MDAFQSCELLLKYVKNSNLNFSLNESPFSVSLSIRKSFVKDKFGAERSSAFTGIFHQDGRLVNENQNLQNEKKSLSALVIHHEREKEVFEQTIGDLSEKLEKARAELMEIMSEKNTLVKAKKNTEKELDEKTNENENLKMEIKTFSKTVKSKENELKNLNLKHENLSETFNKANNEAVALTADKTEAEKKIRKLEKQLKKAQQPVPVSPKLSNSNINNNITPLSSDMSTNSSLNSLEMSDTLTSTPCRETLLSFTPRNQSTEKIKALAEHKDEKAVEGKLPKVDCINYQEAFKDFLENFKEKSEICPKYLLVARQMISNNYNMFHIQLNDIRKFNPNLAGFVRAQNQNLSLEIIQKFIEDKKIGVLKTGLYLNLIKSK